MKWIFISCILLATGVDVLSIHRPKRDLSYIKDLISSKLFGRETIVIQQPEIPKNVAYQLFKIKGYDDILLKVARKPERKKEKVNVVIEKVQDPVIVTPEIAIIGSYLGTKTQSETLLALDIAKNLVKSGILSKMPYEPIQEVVPQEDEEPVKVFIEDRNPVHVYPPLTSAAENNNFVNYNPIPFYPTNYLPMVITSDLKYSPVATKYSYKQMGENADMTFESYNNQDVIVTRTQKEPPLPEFIKLRFAEVASFGANPYPIRSQQPVNEIVEESLVLPMNPLGVPYGYLNPLAVQQSIQDVPNPNAMYSFPIPKRAEPNLEVMEELGYISPNIINNPLVWINRKPIHQHLTVPIGKNARFPMNISDHLMSMVNDTNYITDTVNKLNYIVYGNHRHNKNSKNVVSPELTLSNPKMTAEQSINVNQKNRTEEEQPKTNKTLANGISNNQIVTKYAYKQLGHNNRDKYTVLNLEEAPKYNDLSEANDVAQTVDEVPDDFIFVPPENVDVLPPNMILKTNNMQHPTINNTEDVTIATENYPKGVLLSKFNKLSPTPLDISRTVKTSDQQSLTNDPIVVLEEKLNKKQNTVSTNGRNSFRPYTGGPVF